MAAGDTPDRSAAIRIGIDARAAVEVLAGRGRYVRELLRALNNEADTNTYVLYARRPWEGDLDGRFRWQTIAAPDPVWHVQVAARAGRECDVFLATNSYLTAALLRIPSVVVVHDLLAFDRRMGVPLRSVIVERLTLPVAARRAARVICVSKATATALEERFVRARGKTEVIYLAASKPDGRPSADELARLPPAGFVLSVGTLEPRKNLPRLARAYASLPLDLQLAHPLVIVGPTGWREAETLETLARLRDRCVLLGPVSDRVLSELYRRCAVFCYPSLGEGFGLPVLEAMASGAAVITADVSSLPEIGGDAVLYVDPRSTEGIAQAIARVLASGSFARRLGLSAAGRAARFSWKETAGATLRAIGDSRR